MILSFALSMPAADAAGVFGAIAYSRATGSHGYSFQWGTRHAAERSALSGCRAYARDCQVVVWFYNQCAALAVGRGNGFGYALNRSKRGASGAALANCRGFARGCRIVRSFCSP